MAVLKLKYGLRSAPFLFTEMVGVLLWIMRQNGVSWDIHYIDDFLTIGAWDSAEYSSNVAIMQAVCKQAVLVDKLTTLKDTLRFLHGNKLTDRMSLLGFW